MRVPRYALVVRSADMNLLRKRSMAFWDAADDVYWQTSYVPWPSLHW